MFAMRSLRMTDGFRSGQLSSVDCNNVSVSAASDRHCRTSHYEEAAPSTSCTVSQLSDPCIEPFFRPVDYVESLAEIHEELELASDDEKARLYMEQSFVFRGLGESKMLRRSLRFARQHAITVHDKIVLSAWLKFEKRCEELYEASPTSCTGRRLECPRSALVPGFAPQTATEPCTCDGLDGENVSSVEQCSTSGHTRNDVIFVIDKVRIFCNRQRIAALSGAFHAMLNGSFSESRAKEIEFSDNGISPLGMMAVDEFSKLGRLGLLSPELLLELLCFSNRFCCEMLKAACDMRLASLLHSTLDAAVFLEYALEENAQTLLASCLQIFLWELPGSLHQSQIAALMYGPEGRERFQQVGHASFALYSLLSQAAMEEDANSDLSLALLERAAECAVSSRQRALALHQLGCVTLARKQYTESQDYFARAVEEGHVYSRSGVARAKFKRGLKLAAYAEAASILSSSSKPSGWMYMERALYRDGEEKLEDINRATELDPTLLYPYKYRSALMMDEQKVHQAIEEINRVLGFKVTPDCLELRACFCLALQDYQGASRDVRALLTLDPSYAMYSGRVPAVQLLGLLSQHVDQWTKADCWMQLYDHWSSVDDIGSLAVVHQMLESDSGKGLLFFRQSLLLLRLNCPKAAMRSLRLAREHASSDHEKLVYEGWILYDTGHREEALEKAEESISIQRSFEAFFLKAYALADTSLDPGSSAKVVELLEEALKCPSDGLRKGQALNNLGSVYVDCRELELAADRYVSALKIRHTRAHQGLARVHNLQGDRKSAHEEMTKLIEKARNNASAYEKRSEYGEEREMTMTDLEKVTQLDPLRTYPYRYRAAVLMDSHKEEEAIAELSKAIAFKADLQVLHLRAAFHECIGDLQASLRDCRAVLSMDPSHQDTLDLHSRVHGREAY